MMLEKLSTMIYHIAAILFAFLGIISGTTAFSAICYTNAVLLLILVEIRLYRIKNIHYKGDAK